MSETNKTTTAKGLRRPYRKASIVGSDLSLDCNRYDVKVKARLPRELMAQFTEYVRSHDAKLGKTLEKAVTEYMERHPEGPTS